MKSKNGDFCPSEVSENRAKAADCEHEGVWMLEGSRMEAESGLILSCMKVVSGLLLFV